MLNFKIFLLDTYCFMMRHMLFPSTPITGGPCILICPRAVLMYDCCPGRIIKIPSFTPRFIQFEGKLYCHLPVNTQPTTDHLLFFNFVIYSLI